MPGFGISVTLFWVWTGNNEMLLAILNLHWCATSNNSCPLTVAVNMLPHAWNAHIERYN